MSFHLKVDHYRFLYARFQLDHIARFKQDIYRLYALTQVQMHNPQNVMEIYARILNARPFQNHNPFDHHVMMRAFAWVLYSVTPLSLREVALVSVIDPEDNQNDLNAQLLLASEDYILEL